MKTRLLIIVVIITIGAIIASTLGTMEYQSTYNQNCNSDGGYVVGFLRCTYIRDGVPSVADKYDAKTMECFRLLFHCDASSEYFEGCIGGKKDGITVEEICTNATIEIDDGCVTIPFDENNTVITCE